MAVNDIPLKMSSCNDLHVATTAVESVKIFPQDLQQKTVGSSARFRSMSAPLSASRSATGVSAFASSEGLPKSGGWLSIWSPASIQTCLVLREDLACECVIFTSCQDANCVTYKAACEISLTGTVLGSSLCWRLLRARSREAEKEPELSSGLSALMSDQAITEMIRNP